MAEKRGEYIQKLSDLKMIAERLGIVEQQKVDIFIEQVLAGKISKNNLLKERPSNFTKVEYEQMLDRLNLPTVARNLK